MVLPLLSDGLVVEIEKVPGDDPVRVSRSKLPLLIVFSQPRLSNIKRSVLTSHRHLHVINRNHLESPFLHIRSGAQMSIVENHDVRRYPWHERMAVQKPRNEFGHGDDRGLCTHQRLSDSVSAFGHSLII